MSKTISEKMSVKMICGCGEEHLFTDVLSLTCIHEHSGQWLIVWNDEDGDSPIAEIWTCPKLSSPEEQP